jgi:predicted  nucleic acid-binding Zn-ribbon protein
MAKRKTNEKFIEEVYELVGEEYTFLEEYKGTHNKIKCRHNKCGYIWKTRPSEFLRKKGCPKCAGNLKKTNKQFKQEVKELYGDEYTFLESYKSNNKEKLLCKHNECGTEWKIAPNDFLRGKGCPFCNESEGERLVKKYLRDNNIEYQLEFTFDDLKAKKKLRFDFAIKNNEDLLFLIEYDGIQHFQPKDYFGGYKRFRKSKARDRIKNYYCKNNDIPLLRINYFTKHKMEDLLEEKLQEFNLI